MKLSIDGIKDKTAWEEAGIKLPAYDVRKVAENTKASPVWVHFGIGNIFRIFIGGIADSLIEQGCQIKGLHAWRPLILMLWIRFMSRLTILLWRLH